jgi:hypothetical protein
LGTIKLSQPKLTNEILELGKITAAKRAFTPMDPGVVLLPAGPNDDMLDVSTFPFPVLVGKGLFLVHMHKT